MKKLILSLIVIMALFLQVRAVEESTKFVLIGTIQGITNGEIVLQSWAGMGFKQDTAKIINGTFRFTGDYPIPVSGSLCINNSRKTKLRKQLIIENAKMSLVGSIDEFPNAKITGSRAHSEFEAFLKGKRDIEKRYSKLGGKRAASKKYREQYIENNPASTYAAILVKRSLLFKSIDETHEVLKNLHPDLKNQAVLSKTIKRVENMKKLEIGLDKIMDGVEPITYQIDKEYKGKRIADIIYLAVLKDKTLCALKKDGSILLIDNSGKILKQFKTKSNGKPSAIAVDNEDRIYFLSSQMKQVTKKIRGRKVTKELPVAVVCQIYNKEGHKQKQFILPRVIYASGCRVVDQHLIVSDCKLRKIQIHKADSGEVLKEMDDMRSCCGILDFSVNKKKEIIVANLGAFRIQGFDYNGNSLMAFGKRGRELGDFHGCCNPVSVATLSNGAIVTVEKDPTRIKVYSNKGAKQIEGVEELVKGCSYIPMIVDSENNLYLASEKKGIVKCSPVK